MRPLRKLTFTENDDIPVLSAELETGNNGCCEANINLAEHFANVGGQFVFIEVCLVCDVGIVIWQLMGHD